LSSVSVPAVTALEQSPACDVISVGFESGDILLINLKMDKVLFSFLQDGGAVTSFAFRTDAQSTKFPFLASSSADGRVFIWNLGTRRDAADNDMDSDNEDNGPKKPKLERKLQYIMEEAHMRRVSKLHFLHGEPILISSSTDNSIKMWIFDAPDGTARLLRSRSGHAGTPTKIHNSLAPTPPLPPPIRVSISLVIMSIVSACLSPLYACIEWQVCKNNQTTVETRCAYLIINRIVR
jgi:U3 small nucleolar RNA-associated protein 21